MLVAFNMASSFARKNPLAAIAAFKAAFGRDRKALLVVKVTNGNVYPPGVRALEEACGTHANIVMVSATLPDQALTDLIAGSDVLLSLHRSEGLGLLLAHAMHCGRPIVATDWSASCEFLNPGNACLVPAELVPARDPQRTYDHPQARWAEPCIEAAAQHLRLLRDDPTFAKQLGSRARQDAAELFAPGRLPQFASGPNTPAPEDTRLSQDVIEVPEVA